MIIIIIIISTSLQENCHRSCLHCVIRARSTSSAWNKNKNEKKEEKNFLGFSTWARALKTDSTKLNLLCSCGPVPVVLFGFDIYAIERFIYCWRYIYCLCQLSHEIEILVGTWYYCNYYSTYVAMSVCWYVSLALFVGHRYRSAFAVTIIHWKIEWKQSNGR